MSDVTKPAAPVPAADYDGFAAEYSASKEKGLFQRALQASGDDPPCWRRRRPASAGRRVRVGPLAEALRAKGAVLSGFDLSPAMVKLARQRLGEDADVRVVDLGAPLPYPDDAFDLVVASLYLHYVEDWASALAELRRVLRPGGRLTVSIIHPMIYAILYPTPTTSPSPSTQRTTTTATARSG